MGSGQRSSAGVRARDTLRRRRARQGVGERPRTRAPPSLRLPVAPRLVRFAPPRQGATSGGISRPRAGGVACVGPLGPSRGRVVHRSAAARTPAPRSFYGHVLTTPREAGCDKTYRGERSARPPATPRAPLGPGRLPCTRTRCCGWPRASAAARRTACASRGSLSLARCSSPTATGGSASASSARCGSRGSTPPRGSTGCVAREEQAGTWRALGRSNSQKAWLHVTSHALPPRA